jgi:hypothetical protein
MTVAPALNTNRPTPPPGSRHHRLYWQALDEGHLAVLPLMCRSRSWCAGSRKRVSWFAESRGRCAEIKARNLKYLWLGPLQRKVPRSSRSGSVHGLVVEAFQRHRCRGGVVVSASLDHARKRWSSCFLR